MSNIPSDKNCPIDPAFQGYDWPPPWLENKELQPGNGAYEGLDPVRRGLLKKQIAMLHKIWSTETHQGGFFLDLDVQTTLYSKRSAKKWAVFVLGESYHSPSGFIAAVLPALMAGVENIHIFRQGKAELSPSISAAMELLGLETVYGLSPTECGGAIWSLSRSCPPDDFCLILLGNVRGTEDYFDITEECGAFHTGLPETVKIGLEEASVDTDVLKWLHPGAEVLNDCLGPRLDALITGSELSRKGQGGVNAQLVLTPGQEYFWIWPGLTPLNFYTRKLILSHREG